MSAVQAAAKPESAQRVLSLVCLLFSSLFFPLRIPILTVAFLPGGFGRDLGVTQWQYKT
jgi:hypothetical protein